MIATGTLRASASVAVLLCLLCQPRAAAGVRSFDLQSMQRVFKQAPVRSTVHCGLGSFSQYFRCKDLAARPGCTEDPTKATAECLKALDAQSKANPLSSTTRTETTTSGGSTTTGTQQLSTQIPSFPGSPPRPMLLSGFPATLPPPPPVVSSSAPLKPPAPPGTTGVSVGSVDGFVLVMVFGDGTKCFSNVDSHVNADVQHYGADTFLEAFGTLEGVGKCRPGSHGLGLALLTTEAFAKVVKKGTDCDVNTNARSNLNSNIIGTGLSIGINGGFGVTGGCHRRKRL